VRLEELIDRAALAEMLDTAAELFVVPLRVLGSDGDLIAKSGQEPSLYGYLDSFPAVRAALNDVVARLRSVDLGAGEVACKCITGAAYHALELRYDDRAIGRMVVGPFARPEWSELAAELYELEPSIRPEMAQRLLLEMPRATPEHVGRVARYLARSLDLILFSGHKALLTGNMHLAAMRDNYRELQEKNARLQQAFDRLKELDRLKSNFLATVSHELRTPLTSIIGYSEMLSEGIAGELTQEQGEFVQTIRNKGEQLLDLIKGLLDLSKLESGTMSLRKADLSAGLVIEDVAQTLAPAAKKKAINLVVRTEPGLPGIWADRERMRQVLLNLTENAIKFTPSGGTVTLSAGLTSLEAPAADDTTGLVLMVTKRTAVKLRVADTGIGIPEDERERVFDAFYQVDGSSTREQGGTGLGLSIVRRLVDAHDGTIQIEDNVPNGTVFVVTIPCRRASMV
jgi:signal transduction histidine kinase